MKLAFIGPSAVGKDTVSDYIEKKYSLNHISSSDYIRKYTIENNLGELTRENLSRIAIKMRNEQGSDILVRMAIEECPDNIILSGLRAIDEIKTFKELGGVIIAITAPLQRRYELAKLRKRIDDNVSFEEFKKIADKEYLNKDRNGQNIKQIIEMADIEIVNDRTLEELFKKCEEYIERLK